YAMDAMTTVTASLIDRELEDYMVETAMLKVFTTEALWTIVNDAFQIHGGAAYMTDRPLERMLRDARINQIGEGANEVLVSFIALVGMRGPGLQLQQLWDALHHPASGLRKAWKVGVERVGAAVRVPDVPVRSPQLLLHAQRLGRSIWRFNIEVNRALIRYREEILDRQYVQERIARVAMELFASACVLSRWDAELQSTPARPSTDGVANGAADLFLRRSHRRTHQWLAELRNNDDAAVTATANEALRSK
ncbi:MAG: acyl-CoA dehydrogenase family protein, partial [Gammaproteobacteria bacterium]